MLEADDQFAVLDGDRGFPAGEDEATLPTIRFLDVILFVVGRGDLETHAPRLVARADREGVCGVVLRSLDVVLVRVGPVQLHFLAVVGNQIG